VFLVAEAPRVRSDEVVRDDRSPEGPDTERTGVARSSKSVPDTVQDLKDLLVAYAKQETIDPLRNLGRYLGFGLGGVALLTLGTFFLAMSALRALQTQTGDVFDGFWSWVPYVIVLVGLGALMALAISRITTSSPGPADAVLDPRKAR
jgi:hypothetical protein